MKLSAVTVMLVCLLLILPLAFGDKGSRRSNSRSGSKKRSAGNGGSPLPTDCWDLRQVHNISTDGVYTVYPAEGVNTSVLCDMTTDGGGWTIFQQRYNKALLFNRSYAAYKQGFGDLNGEFWLGNAFLHQFTTNENQTLRIDFCKEDNSSEYAVYDTFAVASSSNCFRLHVAGYHGTARDSLIGNLKTPYHDGQCFSTYDKDEDGFKEINCALINESGWWFNRCFVANLNAVFKDSQIFSVRSTPVETQATTPQCIPAPNITGSDVTNTKFVS